MTRPPHRGSRGMDNKTPRFREVYYPWSGSVELSSVVAVAVAQCCCNRHSRLARRRGTQRADKMQRGKRAGKMRTAVLSSFDSYGE